MTDQPNPDTVPIKPAATVVLTRAMSAGREVLMMRRSANAVFVGGHYVFPGGAVDAEDHEVAADSGLLRRFAVSNALTTGNGPATTGNTDDPTDESLEHAAYVVAAVREAFEEAGLLLARLPSDSWVDLAEARTRDRFRVHRDGLNAGSVSFADILRSENLHIRADDLTYWSRWITPIGPPRRFDARFFVADMPAGHEASPDHGELVHSEWVRPADALHRYELGDFPIIFPTIKTLRSMCDEEFREHLPSDDHVQ